ncbi:glutamate racemase [Oxalobacteraceae bacterium]|nr:glutamate racemase [Oxalobacteraceae bacterium]
MASQDREAEQRQRDPCRYGLSSTRRDRPAACAAGRSRFYFIETILIPTAPFATPSDAPVGIFDSGVGGLSVLRHVRAQLPNEHLMYFADSAHNPYGDKTEAFVVERSLAIAAFLLEQGAKALVVACNTATIAAIKALRATYPTLPLVGVEPGLKPAAAATRSGKVGVLATQRTLSGEKFLLLREQISLATSVEFLLQPCVGLADQIEQGQLDTPETQAMLERYVAPLIAQGADTLVLGSTHYPFARAAIERIANAHIAAAQLAKAQALPAGAAQTQAGAADTPTLPVNGSAVAHAFTAQLDQALLQVNSAITLIDTGDAVTRQLVRLLEGAGLLRASGGQPAELQGYTSAPAATLTRAFDALLKLAPEVQSVAI